jgi:hypothetical protein
MQIDYFEFTILVEACWYDSTILRHSVMEKAINAWYHELNQNEKRRAYEFFKRTKGEEVTTEVQERFMARYNPDNQYLVGYKNKSMKKEEFCRAYKYNGIYWLSTTQFVPEEIIKTVTPLTQ